MNLEVLFVSETISKWITKLIGASLFPKGLYELLEIAGNLYFLVHFDLVERG